MPAHPKSPHLYLEEDRGYATACWIWQRGTNVPGYGVVSVQGRHEMAHRHFYERARGPIPPGLELDHLCRVRLCVNPDHLEPVTHAENGRRGASAKLTRAAVEAIRARLARGESAAAVARDFGVSDWTAGAIRRGVRWA